MRQLIIIALLGSIAFAAEVVTFDNNWGQHPLINVMSQSPAGLDIVFSTHRMVVNEMDIDGVVMRNYGVPGMFLWSDEGIFQKIQVTYYEFLVNFH